ncbi:LOW QUALITY PROTEIN: hypothetical protein TorRG33x02_299770 [Trema orientale]|uniref:Uncharacterized protein n=1 Tax=Trema orientale TaxID=63057 RepID=A0A2P5C2T2_TREOI|nr:LOW QUALITY PROTEIN: hypothetical protein TorRG33x02_299770 [Trema orientale]
MGPMRPNPFPVGFSTVNEETVIVGSTDPTVHTHFASWGADKYFLQYGTCSCTRCTTRAWLKKKKKRKKSSGKKVKIKI